MPLVDPITMSSASPSSPANLHPTTLLSTTQSRIYSYLHTPLLILTFTLLFPRLVADPPTTLRTLLLLLILLQTTYCILCLPPTKSTSPRPVRTPKKQPSGPTTKKAPDATQSSFTPALLAHTLLTLILTALLTPALLAVQILLGAPLTTHLPSTTLSSLHLALLTLFPILYTRGLNSTTWQALLSGQGPVDEVSCAAAGACVGAWLGAVPFPLDWDREWQRWPVTVVVGMWIGVGVGRVVGSVVVGMGWGKGKGKVA